MNCCNGFGKIILPTITVIKKMKTERGDLISKTIFPFFLFCEIRQNYAKKGVRPSYTTFKMQSCLGDWFSSLMTVLVLFLQDMKDW